MSRRGLVLSLLCALVVAALGTSVWLAMGTARHAMAHQIRAAEGLAASERAMALDGAIAAATARLDDLADQATTVHGLSEAQQLEIGMGVLMAQSGSLGATVALMDGTVIAEAGTAPAVPTTTTPQLRAREGGRDASLILSREVTMPPATEPMAVVVHEVSLARLAPVFDQPFAEFQGATSLATTDGRLLMSTVGTTTARVDNEAILALLRSGEPGFATYRSDRFDSDRIGATHPVGTGDLVVIVGADARSFAEPASALVRRLAAVLAVTAVVVGGLVAAIVAIQRRARRHLTDAAALALVDPLTGLTNRRGLEARVASIRAAAVVAIDVDGLKVLNDSEGHAAGDRAIVLVAQAMRGAVRADDVVARVGGDEFVIVMPGASRERAERAVRSISENLADDDLRFSAGIAMAPPGSFADALTRADAELYVRKRERRETVLA